jgi:hypothetical protein
MEWLRRYSSGEMSACGPSFAAVEQLGRFDDVQNVSHN